MKVSFGSDGLRDCCCYFENAEERLGLFLAEALFSMIADAEATDHALEWHEILVDDVHFANDNIFEVRIGTGLSAAFVPVGQSYSVHSDGNVDWSTVTRIKLLDLVRRP